MMTVMDPVTAGLARIGDAWRLPLAGPAVVQCRVDHAVTFCFDSPDGVHDLRIEEDFVFVSADGVEVVSTPGGAPALWWGEDVRSVDVELTRHDWGSSPVAGEERRRPRGAW
ncbi:hypothetical protein [Saccharothrix longispora]|uniref:hypothetical protein n=1 Tax=Saccharothrix longispora TaxID=33920 RepID=UPI0028FD49EC|nr:hypothetical protein [Saccharothrix longispora]MDU0290439.1 hypothetical protein [Saccharothrix longispora]